jgi:tetratricopeptide (TPR) repeat protein
VDASLVVPVDAAPDVPRYRMLDTIQEYGAELLGADPHAEAVRRRHADYFLHLAEQAEPALQGQGQGAWYGRLERDHENVRAALGWLLQAGDAERALRLAGAVWRFWQRHGDLAEGRRWLEAGLAGGASVPAAVRSKALWGATWLAYHQGDYARTKALSAAHLAIARELGHPIDIRNALTGLGIAATAEGRHAEALLPLQEALDVCRPLGRTWHLATSLLNLGTATLHVGDCGRAGELCAEALAIYRALGDEVFTATAIEHLGYVALLQGDHDRAARRFRNSLAVCFALRETARTAEGLESLAALHAKTGAARAAARLAGAAAGLRERIAGAPSAFLRAIWQPYVDEAARHLGRAAWQAAWEEGRAMPVEQAVALALSEPVPSCSAPMA